MFSSLSVSQKRWGEEKGVLILALSQSRSSLYTGYTSCVGPPKHQGALKDVFILVLFLNLASGYENKNDHLFLFSGALSSSIRKNQSNHVTWMSYSLLLLQKKRIESVRSCGRDNVSAIRDGVKHGQMPVWINSTWQRLSISSEAVG